MRFWLRLGNSSFGLYFELGEFRDRQEIMQFCIIEFVGWLRWLFRVAWGQVKVNETVTDSDNLPAPLGITCIANLAVFTAVLF